MLCMELLLYQARLDLWLSFQGMMMNMGPAALMAVSMCFTHVVPIFCPAA